MTGLESRSLGAEEYRRQLSAVGLSLNSEYEDEGQSHYFDAFKGGIDKNPGPTKKAGPMRDFRRQEDVTRYLAGHPDTLVVLQWHLPGCGPCMTCSTTMSRPG